MSYVAVYTGCVCLRVYVGDKSGNRIFPETYVYFRKYTYISGNIRFGVGYKMGNRIFPETYVYFEKVIFPLTREPAKQ